MSLYKEREREKKTWSSERSSEGHDVICSMTVLKASLSLWFQ